MTIKWKRSAMLTSCSAIFSAPANWRNRPWEEEGGMRGGRKGGREGREGGRGGGSDGWKQRREGREGRARRGRRKVLEGVREGGRGRRGEGREGGVGRRGEGGRGRGGEGRNRGEGEPLSETRPASLARGGSGRLARRTEAAGQPPKGEAVKRETQAWCEQRGAN